MIRTALVLLLVLVGAARAAAAEPDGAASFNAFDGGSAWRHWALNCQGCHRPDGSGSPGGAPPMNGFVARFLSAPGGREYLTRVPGVATSALSSAELAEVLNWLVRRFDPQNLPPGFKPFTAEELAVGRRKPYRTDAPAARAALLSEMRTP